MGFDQDRVALFGDSDSLDNVFDLQDDSEDFLFTAKEVWGRDSSVRASLC